jgi:hypothetical protein
VQQVDAGRGERSHHRLSRAETVLDERQSPGEELLVPTPKERLVPIPVMRPANSARSAHADTVDAGARLDTEVSPML